MSLREIRKSNVQENYDREAVCYQSASDMQKGCFARLMSLAADSIREIAPQRIVDIGCGTGSAVPQLRSQGVLAGASYLGIDLSPQMIALAKQCYESDRIAFATGDVENLQLPDKSADLVMSNAVLHWVNQPKLGMMPNKAFAEISRILRPGGVFMMSVAGRGKAHRLLSVYRSVMDSYRERPGFNEALYLDDPIGRFDIHELVILALGVKLKPKIAHLTYQPITFASPYEYTKAVRAYGFIPFMAPLPPELREEAWPAIEERFADMVGHGPYLHDYYINYLIADKVQD